MLIRVDGAANLGAVQAEVAAVTTQVEKLNAQLRATSTIPMAPKGQPIAKTVENYRMAGKYAQAASGQFAAALGASGAWRAEMVRIPNVIDKATDALARQKLTFGQVFGKKSRTMMQSLYKEQLALQKAVAMSTPGGVGTGKSKMTLAVPSSVPKSWDTLSNRVGFFEARLRSASVQMVNWGKNMQWSGRQLMAGLTLPVAAFGAAAGVMAYKVDKEFTRVQKVYETTASATSTMVTEQKAYNKEIADLRVDTLDTATKAAQNYGVAVNDTISVQADLAATGQKGDALQKATTEVVRNATLGEIDYQTATTATIALQQQLHLSTTELSDSWAYMNAVENKTSLTMKDFAAAIPIALSPIRQMGGDLQDLGTLMTAMVSQGIQVGKAANAIKAMPQRLSRPSKQVQEEFKMLTGQDIMELNAKNPDNIIGLLTSIGDAVKPLDTLARRKALAGLFGSFQLGNMNAMLAGMEDLKNGVNQTTDAFNIGKQSVRDWHKISDQEIAAFQNSASGKFKIAVESIKAELGKLGKPFLTVATGIVKVASGILKFFNALPKGVKYIAILALLFGALLGPVIMLTGLFVQLAGNVGKMVASALRLGSSFGILTKSEVAAKIEAAFLDQQMVHQADTATLLTARIEALTMATSQYAAVMRQGMGIPMSGPGAVNPGAHLPAVPTQAVMAAAYKDQQKSGIVLRDEKGKFTSAEAKATADSAKISERAAIGAAAAREREAVATAKSRANMTGMGIAGAAMAGSMATMMITSNKTANTIAQMVLMAAIIGPAFKMIGPALVFANAKATGLIARMAVLNLSAKGLGKGLVSGAASIVKFLGPVGMVGAAVAIVGVGLYAWHKHIEAARKEQEAQNRSLLTTKNLLEDTLKIESKRRKTLDTKTASEVDGGPTTEELSKELVSTKEGKDLVDLYKNAESSTERVTIAATKYNQILQSTGGTAAKARQYLEAMFLAAGDGALKAETKAKYYFDEIGSSLSSSQSAYILNSKIVGLLGESDKSVKEAGTDMGKDLADSIANSLGDKTDSIVDNYKDAFTNSYEKAFKDFDPYTKTMIGNYGIDNVDQLKGALADINSGMGDKDLELKYHIDEGQLVDFNHQVLDAGDQIRDILQAEQASAQEVAGQLGITGDRLKNITNLQQLRATWEYKLQTATKENAQSLMDAKIAEQERLMTAMTMGTIQMKASDAQKLQVLNQIRLTLGMSETNNLADGFVDKLAEANNLIVKAARNSGSIQFHFKTDDMKTILKNTMSNVQSQMSSMASAQLDSQAKAASDALTTYWDNRSKALEKQQDAASDRLAKKQDKAQNELDKHQDKRKRKFDRRQDAESEAFDKAWDNRKNKIDSEYDNRINGINKEIEAEQKAEDMRQKMFEAEQQRIERLNDARNKTIDFKVALSSGNLDEAAKVQNDINAQASQWALADAGNSSSTASQKKQDALQGTADSLDKEREVREKALEAEEEDARKSFERRQEREARHLDNVQKKQKDHLDAIQAMQNKHLQATQDKQKIALDAQTKASMAANDAEWADRKASLDSMLTLFTSFTATSKVQLDKWMQKTGLSYSDFGITSGDWFNKAFKEQLRLEGAQLGSDNMWSDMGGDVAKQTIRGMGFGGLKQFAQFVKTGQLPDNFGNKASKTPSGPPRQGHKDDPGTHDFGPSYHVGGEIGKDAGGRKGVARTMRGNAPSEVSIRAQKGEFMVNKDAASKHGGLLRAINSGRMNSSRNNVGFGTGGDGGQVTATGGFAAALGGSGIAAGVGKALQNAFNNRLGMLSGSGGSFAGGAGGAFGDEGNYDADQLKNAAIIASVGSQLGMTARDIQIGIMTAIAESNLKNISYGDRDSVGLFQQRTSQGWGTVEQILDPNYAATQFFNHLKGVSGRDGMDPWLAAQAVQRSAFSDGSNYRRWWDEAQDIFKSGLVRNEDGYSTNGLSGPGGKHLISVPGKGWSTPHDYLNGMGSPVYAFDDGFISKAKATTSGGTPGNGLYGNKYTSYGEVMEVTSHDGHKIMTAHMQPGTTSKWRVGQPVAGGTLLGLSDMTGNASGPHTHIEVDGSGTYGNARGALASLGIGLDGGSRSGPVGGAGDMGIGGDSAGSAWTYGNLPGLDGYDPYAGLAQWKADQQAAADAAAAAAAKATRQAARAAKRAERDALQATVDFETNNFHAQQAILAALRAEKPTGTGAGLQSRINTAVWIKDQIKARMEAAQAALAAWKAANQAALDDDETGGSDAPPVLDTSGGATIRSGTYNVLFSNSAAKKKSDLQNLMGKADILGLTEMSTGRDEIMSWLGDKGWGTQGPGDSVLTWNKSKMTKVEGGNKLLNTKTTSEPGGKQRWATWAKMKDIASGRQFIQAVAHTINPPHDNPANIAVQKEQFGNLKTLYGDLKKKGVPVVMGGDFNDDIRRNGFDIGDGLVSNWKGKTDSGQYTIGKSYYDNQFYDPKMMSLLSQQVVGGLNSDHNALLTQFNIPSHADGAQNVTWDNTLVNLHKGEGVLTEAQNKKFRDLANNPERAMGGKTEYNVTMQVNNPNLNEEQVAQRAVQLIKAAERRGPQSRTVNV